MREIWGLFKKHILEKEGWNIAKPMQLLSVGLNYRGYLVILFCWTDTRALSVRHG